MLNELENLGLRPRHFRIPQRNPTVSTGADVTPLETRTGRPRERSARYCNPRDETSPDAKSKPLSLALGNESRHLRAATSVASDTPGFVPTRSEAGARVDAAYRVGATASAFAGVRVRADRPSSTPCSFARIPAKVVSPGRIRATTSTPSQSPRCALVATSRCAHDPTTDVLRSKRGTRADRWPARCTSLGASALAPLRSIQKSASRCPRVSKIATGRDPFGFDGGRANSRGMPRNLRVEPAQKAGKPHPGHVGPVGFSCYCWTRSTTGMIVGGCASSMPSSSMTGPRYVRNSSNASWLSQTSKT